MTNAESTTGKTEQQWDPIPETWQEALAKWDAGDSVFSVEMGGLGPGYEQCIQIAAFEVIRTIGPMASGLDWDNADARKPLNEAAEATLTRIDKDLRMSGAQAGAAKSLAGNVVCRGYRAALRDPAVKDRLIQVSKRLPSLSEGGAA